MEMNQVMSDRDSEDEVDDDIADLEDRRVWFTILHLNISNFFLLQSYACWSRL